MVQVLLYSSSIQSIFIEHLMLPSSDRNIKLEMVPALMDLTVRCRMWTSKHTVTI